MRVDFEGAGSLASHIVNAQPRGTDDDGSDPCDGNGGTQGYFEHAHSPVSSPDTGACRIDAARTQRSCEEQGCVERRNGRRHVFLRRPVIAGECGPKQFRGYRSDWGTAFPPNCARLLQNRHFQPVAPLALPRDRRGFRLRTALPPILVRLGIPLLDKWVPLTVTKSVPFTVISNMVGGRYASGV